MAINIFQGGKSSNRPVNSAAASTRAQNAQAALTTPSSTSSSGLTAVANKGTLAKVGNTVGKVAGIAAKFLPGIGGVVAKGLSNVLNDPEWWQSVPGDAVTLNQPLRPVRYGKDGYSEYAFRIAIAEFTRYNSAQPASPAGIIEPSDQMITQYLMPEIRKVVNAVPLQTADAYRAVLRTNATIYAYWRTAKKFRYMMTHGQTYMANMNTEMFPLFQTQNSAALDAIINRLEEYLRANVRLPHTLCEYLAWRFGRVYKSSDSAKASLIVYNAFPFTLTPADINSHIEAMMSAISNSAVNQAASADMYNAYFDHDLMVEIRDDTQYTFDRKEFALRTNLDLNSSNPITPIADEDPNPIYIDSSLDNPTAFMASTVSTVGAAMSGTRYVLFPVDHVTFYVPLGNQLGNVETPGFVLPHVFSTDVTGTEYDHTFGFETIGDDETRWARFTVTGGALLFNEISDDVLPTKTVIQRLRTWLLAFVCFKACEIYNKNLMLAMAVVKANDLSDQTRVDVDVSAPTYDMALVPDTTIGQEQVYAFANLVDVGRKHSLSYKAAEKMVAKETANMIESLDVAAQATKPLPAASANA